MNKIIFYCNKEKFIFDIININYIKKIHTIDIVFKKEILNNIVNVLYDNYIDSDFLQIYYNNLLYTITKYRILDITNDKFIIGYFNENINIEKLRFKKLKYLNE